MTTEHDDCLLDDCLHDDLGIRWQAEIDKMRAVAEADGMEFVWLGDKSLDSNQAAAAAGSAPRVGGQSGQGVAAPADPKGVGSKEL